jgi:hypothetical protein
VIAVNLINNCHNSIIMGVIMRESGPKLDPEYPKNPTRPAF